MKPILQIALFYIFLCLFPPLQAQIWTPKPIEFTAASQGWRVRPVDDKVAWTFGYSIRPFPIGWGFTGFDNSIQVTTDGGETWQTKFFKDNIDEEGYIGDVIGVNDSVAFVTYFDYVIGSSLYRTSDGGKTWKSNKTGIDSYLNWVYFYDKNNGISFGDAGFTGSSEFYQISSTKDGGATWSKNDSVSIRPKNPEEFGVKGGFAVKDNHLWALTFYGRILHSADYGANWEAIDGAQFKAIPWGFAADDSLNLYEIWNVDGKFDIYKLENGGNTWVNISPTNNKGEIVGFSAVPGTNTLLFNAPAKSDDISTYKTWMSTDEGTTWNVISEGEGKKFGFIEFCNPQTGYACEIPTSFQKPTKNVFKYSGSPLTGLVSQQKLDAEVEVFPNPASDFLNVKIISEKPNDFWILINDMNGKLMSKQIVNNQSKIETLIKIDQLPVGAYLINIASKDGVTGKKFIKLIE
jgi:hypothetical protein